MVKIFPNLTDKIYPGCGYNYFSAEAVQSSSYRTISDLKNKNFLDLRSEEKQPIRMTDVITAIKSNDIEGLRNNSDLKDVCASRFVQETKNDYSSEFFVSLSQLLDFYGYNGASNVQMINSNRRSLCNHVEFNESDLSFFVYQRTMLLDWTFDPDENIFNPLIDSPTEFVQVHGDSFVHSIHFGKSSAYQINLSKSVFEEGIVQKDLKKSIDSFLNNEMSDKLTKWLKNTISAENCRVYRLPFGSFKAPEESEPITMNELKELLRLQNSQTALSPTVIDADISFYPDRIVAGALFKSREPFCSRFEQNVAPNCVDLFQSMRYLEHLADNLGSKNGEKTSLNEIKLREKAFDLKKNLLKAKEWTKKQSQMLNEISTLSLPDASNVFEGMDEEAENGNLIEKNKSYNRKTEDMEKMSFYKIDKSEKKIKDIKMATENMVSVNKVDYKTIVWLCIELTRALEKYSSQTIDSSSEIPKFVVFASFNKNVPTLLSNESHFGDFGPGLLVYRCPKSFAESMQFVKSLKKYFGVIPKFLIVLRINDNDYITKEISPPDVRFSKNNDCSPRAISFHPDKQRLFLHATTNPINKIPELRAAEMINLSSYHDRLVENFDERNDNISLARKLGIKIDADLKNIPGPPLYWPDAFPFTDLNVVEEFLSSVQKELDYHPDSNKTKPLKDVQKLLSEMSILINLGRKSPRVTNTVNELRANVNGKEVEDGLMMVEYMNDGYENEVKAAVKFVPIHLIDVSNVSEDGFEI